MVVSVLSAIPLPEGTWICYLLHESFAIYKVQVLLSQSSVPLLDGEQNSPYVKSRPCVKFRPYGETSKWGRIKSSIAYNKFFLVIFYKIRLHNSVFQAIQSEQER